MRVEGTVPIARRPPPPPPPTAPAVQPAPLLLYPSVEVPPVSPSTARSREGFIAPPPGVPRPPAQLPPAAVVGAVPVLVAPDVIAQQHSAPADSDEASDVTRTVPRDRSWRLTLADGTVTAITRSLLLGREPGDSTDGFDTLTIHDPDQSVSKQHARIDVVGTAAWLHNLQSTNGVRIVLQGGSETEVDPANPVELTHGCDIELGSYVLQISH